MGRRGEVGRCVGERERGLEVMAGPVRPYDTPQIPHHNLFPRGLPALPQERLSGTCGRGGG